MKKTRRILSSVGISVLIHCLFFAGATKVMFTSAVQEPTREKRNFRIKKLHTMLPEKRSFHARQVDYTERIQFEKPAKLELTEENLETFEIAKQKTKVQTFNEKIDSLHDSRLNDYTENADKKFKDFSALKKEPPPEDGSSIIELSQVKGQNMAVAPDQVIDEDLPTEEFEGKMPGFTPKWNPMVTNIEAVDAENFTERKYQPLISKKSKFTDLKEYLISEILTYEDPKTNEKYFQINMKVGKDSDELKTIPKEIVFLIDCSKSTTEKRFRQFKQGLEHSLKNLNPDDKFNIIAFKKFSVEFQPESVSPTEENVQNALLFVDDLTLGTRTDANSALLKSIEKPVMMNPSYVIFLSDGFPTQGVTEPRKIIHKVSETNNSRRSIFGFSGGMNVNRYFLDFVTYKNRGWSEYSYRSHQIGQYLANMYEKLKDPLLVNVRYHASGLNENEIYPKLLPDFFRNIEFSLFGRYEDDDEFVLQMVGDVEGEVTEYLIESALSQAAKGDESIAKNWAFNKIYELISQIKDDQDNSQLIEQIEKLSKRYKIKTPYR